MQESIFSPYVEDISPEASQQRFIFGKGSRDLYREAYWAYQYEKFLAAREAALKEIETHRRTYGEEGEAEKLARWQEEKLELENIDSGRGFNVAGKLLPKHTFQLGNTKNPQFRILVLAGTHGGESRLARTILEGIIQLAHPGQERYRLLDKGTILFDPIVDPGWF